MHSILEGTENILSIESNLRAVREKEIRNVRTKLFGRHLIKSIK